MNVSTHLKQVVNYNLWANKKIAEVLVQLSAEESNKEIQSSFSSIRKTVYHIWDAEFIWLKRLDGLSLSTFPSKEFDDFIALNTFITSSEDWVNRVKEEQEDFFAKKCTYKNIAQKEFTSSHSEMIAHCMNHSTYHRGQLVTMLRQVGKTELPSTDMIAYFRE